MSDRNHKGAGGARPPIEDATVPVELPPAAEGWDDATRLDPPGAIDALLMAPEGGSNTEATAAQEIIAALGKALRSPLPGRALDEEETVGVFGDPPAAKPARVPASPTQPARPANVARPEPAPPSTRAKAEAAPELSSEPPISWDEPSAWDEPSTSTDAGFTAAVPDGTAPSGPFGADSTELDLSLWAVEEQRRAPVASTSPWDSKLPALSPKPATSMSTPSDFAPSGPVLNADGVIEHEPPRRAAPTTTPSAAPRVVLGRPVEDPSEPVAPKRAPTRVRPAGPGSLDEPALPDVGFEAESSTNTFARFGNLAVSRKRALDFFRRGAVNPANPTNRPAGVGVPVGAERKSYRVLVRMLAIAGVLIIGVLIGFLITMSIKG